MRSGPDLRYQMKGDTSVGLETKESQDNVKDGVEETRCREVDGWRKEVEFLKTFEACGS